MELTWSSSRSMTGNLIKGSNSASSSDALPKDPLSSAHSMTPSNNWNSEQACNRVALKLREALQGWEPICTGSLDSG